MKLNEDFHGGLLGYKFQTIKELNEKIIGHKLYQTLLTIFFFL